MCCSGKLLLPASAASPSTTPEKIIAPVIRKAGRRIFSPENAQPRWPFLRQQAQNRTLAFLGLLAKAQRCSSHRSASLIEIVAVDY